MLPLLIILRQASFKPDIWSYSYLLLAYKREPNAEAKVSFSITELRSYVGRTNVTDRL